MQLEYINPSALGRAEAVLSRGFPARPAAFWSRLLAELDSFHQGSHGAPVGLLLVNNGQDVGVILTIESATPGPAARKLNVSSWYVDEAARIFAPLMLKAAARDAALLTDLTPTPAVQVVNERLGITARVRGSMLVPTLTDSLLPAPGKVRSVAAGPDAPLLRDHAAMGMLCATLAAADGTEEPLIFLPTAMRGAAGARLIYCRSLALLRRHRGAVARYLLRQGKLFLEIEGNRQETWPGALHAPSRCLVFAKGELRPDTIDHTYTELAFIHASARSAA